MPKHPILPKCVALSVLLLMPLLTGCGNERPRIALPPAERAAPVAYPAIPVGEAVCNGAPCLSDRENAAVLAGFADALDKANARLLWLRDWIREAGK